MFRSRARASGSSLPPTRPTSSAASACWSSCTSGIASWKRRDVQADRRSIVMTPDQVESIQASFAKVAPIAETAAGLFYNRLFEIAPEVKPLFRGDMTEQGRKLMKTLTVVVNGLGNLELILPAASALAKGHVV